MRTALRCVCRPAKGIYKFRPCLLHFGQLSRQEKRKVKQALGMR